MLLEVSCQARSATCINPMVPSAADNPVCSRHGADTRAEAFDGNTPAHFAAERGHLQVLTALLQVGAQCYVHGSASAEDEC